MVGKAKTEAVAVDELSFETALKELEQIVARLEQGRSRSGGFHRALRARPGAESALREKAEGRRKPPGEDRPWWRNCNGRGTIRPRIGLI
ncbi:MAG: hypothetical protein WDM86_20530 [Rhizomicrobium sp.]